ncbi:hypothetical protein SK128_006538 [Halocaridina rubra]|uniref:Uncharacterized protein n=1 Tax=Halocaridina rubra TaxID=373956 RepID=A0AAN9A9Q1_HALRR
MRRGFQTSMPPPEHPARTLEGEMELDDSPPEEGWITVGKKKCQRTTSNNSQNRSTSTDNVNNASQTTTLNPEETPDSETAPVLLLSPFHHKHSSNLLLNPELHQNHHPNPFMP